MSEQTNLQQRIESLEQWRNKWALMGGVLGLLILGFTGYDYLSLPRRVSEVLKLRDREVEEIKELHKQAKKEASEIHAYCEGVHNGAIVLKSLKVDDIRVQRVFALDVPKDKQFRPDENVDEPRPYISMTVVNDTPRLILYNGVGSQAIVTDEKGNLSIPTAQGTPKNIVKEK